MNHDTSLVDDGQMSKWSQRVAEILREVLALPESETSSSQDIVVSDDISSVTVSSGVSDAFAGPRVQYRAQPPGRSFWTKCPQCGTLQALDQGAWAHVNSYLIYCCGFCTFHQLITIDLVDFSDPEHVDPVVDVLFCMDCNNHTLLLLASGRKDCLNCTQQDDFVVSEKDANETAVVLTETRDREVC